MSRETSTISLALLLTVLPIDIAIGAEEHIASNWRWAWQFHISPTFSKTSGLPSSIHVVVTNRSTRPLQGSNLILDIYVEGEFFGWGIMESLRAELLEVDPRRTLERDIDFQSLQFIDLHGRPLDYNWTASKLRRSRWSCIASLTDLISEKPLTESSFSVWSNKVAFEPKVDND